MRGAPRTAVATLLAAASAAAADLGVPRDGRDRVLLDDGRVVDARVLPREGEILPLEFAAGTVRVHRSRVREVRLWKEFDPAPRNDAEKEKAEKGYVRWNGVLVPPATAEKSRAEEVEKEKRLANPPVPERPWDSASRHDCGNFYAWSNAAPGEQQFWWAALAALGKSLGEFLPQQAPATFVVVHLYRDQASWDQVKKWESRGERPKVQAIVGTGSRETLQGVVMPAAAALFCRRVMQENHLTGRAGGWARHGLGRYFGTARFQDGALAVGTVDDASLLAYREMEAAGRLPSMQELLMSGTEFQDEDSKSDTSWAEVKETFEKSYAPYAWLLVHYLVHGEGGKHRDGFVKWLHFWMNAKVGKALDTSRNYREWREGFLKCIKVGDVDNLYPAMKAHAATLKYVNPETHVAIAARRWKAKDAEGALANLEEVVRMAPKDGAALCAAGRICAELPEKGARAAEILRMAVEADPLLPDARSALAPLLQGEEAESQRLLGESLRGTPSTPTVK